MKDIIALSLFVFFFFVCGMSDLHLSPSVMISLCTIYYAQVTAAYLVISQSKSKDLLYVRDILLLNPNIISFSFLLTTEIETCQ